MQTLLAYPDFAAAARCLDYRRLGKMRVEAFQIRRTLSGESAGWRNHPAVRMWRGYEVALSAYMNACITEWVRRGYRNTMALADVPPTYPMPPWLDDTFCRAHRSNLLRKQPDWYSQFGWQESPDLPYVWPV